MTSQGKTSLRFATWNIRGIKNPPQKLSTLWKILRSFKLDIVFIQETHIGVEMFFKKLMEDELGNKWKIYFTVHSSRSKGVAILIRNGIQFEYISHDEDCSGGYIVLFCHLCGELYTLVSVYNHKKDRKVLDRLKHYLNATAQGSLVVGGDFNTGNSVLRDISEDFCVSLSLKDTWPHLHPNDEGFTWHQNDRCSRIDRFFLTEEKMEQVLNMEVINDGHEVQRISDHYPLVLELKVQRQTVAMRLEKFKYRSDRRPGKISGAEILAAIQSLPNEKEHTLSMNSAMSIRQLEQHRPKIQYLVINMHSQTETLKKKFNDMILRQQVPENFKHFKDSYTFTMDYLILSEVLAKRLNDFTSLETKCVSSCVIVIFERSPQQIKCSFLDKIFKKLDHEYKQKDSKQAPFAPPPDFCILDHLLPKTESSIVLQPGCPLTNGILNMALDQLDQIVTSETNWKTTVSYHKKSMVIHAQESEEDKIFTLIKEFQEASGVRLSFR